MKIVKLSSSLGNLKVKGCEKAPDEIIEQLKDIWLSEDFKKPRFEIEDVNVDDLENIERNIRDGDIFVGGDHSITYYCFKKFMSKSDGLIIFDAHPDVFSQFKFPSHEDWLRFLIDKNFINRENVILVGIRNLDEKELNFLKENKIRFFTCKQIFNNIENICDSVMELSREFNKFYLSIDIDVVDPSAAPGTGYIEPGGLRSRELIYFIQRLKLLKNLKKVDIVEVNPNLDLNKMTSKLAAKLIAELI